ncbi:alanine racemase [Acidaminobacterium chupaoyuni]
MDLKYYNSYLQVDLDKICGNIEKIRKHIGEKKDIIPVVKSNAYGLGTVEVARALAEKCNIRLIANSHIAESIAIREAGIKTDLMILGALPPHALRYAPRYQIQTTVFNKETAEILSDECRKLGTTAKIHIKLETGLGRIGVKPGEDLETLLNDLKQFDNLEVVGVFTHFATAGKYESAYTHQQMALFEQGLAQIRAFGIEPQYIHVANTGATVWLKEDCCTHVRCGSLYLGYSNLCDKSNPLGVEEPATWRAFITNIKTIQPGESVGYLRHFVAEKPTRVATVSVGYGDGLNRMLAQEFGPVVVHGVKTRYLGTCMDQCFVDVTDIDCKLFDEVTLLGYDSGRLLSLFELAETVHQNVHSVLSAISPAVLRVYEK